MRCKRQIVVCTLQGEFQRRAVLDEIVIDIVHKGSDRGLFI